MNIVVEGIAAPDERKLVTYKAERALKIEDVTVIGEVALVSLPNVFGVPKLNFTLGEELGIVIVNKTPDPQPFKVTIIEAPASDVEGSVPA